MVVLQYPAVLQKDDNGTWLVTFPDFDDAVTFGDTPDVALAHAVDALETVIVSRMKHELDVPTPSPARGRPLVSIPPRIAAKALLYKELTVTENAFERFEMGEARQAPFFDIPEVVHCAGRVLPRSPRVAQR